MCMAVIFSSRLCYVWDLMINNLKKEQRFDFKFNKKEADLYEKEFIWRETDGIFGDSRISVYDWINCRVL